MKLTNTQNMKATKSGMTLLELTVVILVLLSLIAILFIGARAWKKGSDRAASVLQIRNVQQAVRSFANMNGLNPGDTNTEVGEKNIGDGTITGNVFGAGKFIETDPTGPDGGHPAGGGYTFVFTNAAEIPEIGTLYMVTGGAGTGVNAEATTYYDPDSTTTADW